MVADAPPMDPHHRCRGRSRRKCPLTDVNTVGPANCRQEELKTVCKHFLNKASPDTVAVTTVDRLGLDVRVKARDLTDEFRIGFRQPVRRGARVANNALVVVNAEAICWQRTFNL